MAEPLTLRFQADTSRAQSAMASLAAQVVGNMTSIGVAMAGGASNSNSFSNSLSMMQANVSKAARAVGADVSKIAGDTAAAAAKDGATLEGVVRSFTAAAVRSNTAHATVSAGVSGTTTTIKTLAEQIPSMGTLLGALLALGAAKLVFDSVAASIEAARKHVEEFTKITKDAAAAGIGTTLFQRLTLEAKGLGLTTEQVVASLNAARLASTNVVGDADNEGERKTNVSPFSLRLGRHVAAGNLSPEDRAAFDTAANLEARYRVVIDLIDKLREGGRELAAFDLAGKFFGADFRKQLEDGVEATRRMRDTLDSKSDTAGGKRIVDPEELVRAAQLESKLGDINRLFATGLAPIQKDISNSALDVYNTFLDWELSLARSVKAGGDLYNALKLLPSIKIPSMGELATMLGAPALGDKLGLPQLVGTTSTNETNAQIAERRTMKEARDTLALRMTPGNVAKAIEASDRLDFRAKPPVEDKTKALPTVYTPAKSKGGSASASEQLDAVEQLINAIEKARDTAQAELETVGKTNVEREKAVALAKAEAAAREEFQKGKRKEAALDDDERTRVLAAAESWQTYKDRVMDAQQALRAAAEDARYFGQIAADSLSDAILEGRSFTDILVGIGKQLARSSLQAAFVGQGPLANLLGTAPAASAGPGAVGGLGSILSLLGGSGSNVANVPLPGAQGPSLPTGSIFSGIASLFRANGGDMQAGQPYTVGEAGRELFIPNQNGRMVPIERGPAGGTGNSIGAIDARTTINAQNADAAGLARVERILREQEAALPKRIHELQRRSAR